MPFTISNQLEELTAEAASSQRVVRALLLAPEGYGRTWLLHRVEESLAGRGQRTLRVSCKSQSAPASLLRALLHVGDATMGAALDALEVAEQFSTLSPESQKLALELLSGVLGKKGQRRGTAGLDAEGLREGAFLELARWLELEAARGPLLVAVDDAHLAEGDSAAFLEFLVHLERPMPLALVLSTDANAEHASPAFQERLSIWRSEPNWHRLHLPMMDSAEVRAVLEKRGANKEWVAPITQAARGNIGLALRLLEFVRAHPERLHGTLPGTFDGLRVESLRAMGQEAQTCAHAAAVLGDSFPVAALVAALGPGAPGLDALASAGVVRSTGVEAVARYAFVEPLTRRALLTALPKGISDQWRFAAGMWAVSALEALTPENFDDAAESLLPAAIPVLDATDASLWNEAWAENLSSRAEATAALQKAMAGASGVRKLVLARRVAEAELFFGKPAQALATLSGVVRGPPAPSPLPPVAAGRILSSQPRKALDRWDYLSPEEALAAVDLVRAECLSHLVKKEDTVAAFEELEKKLGKLSGPASSHLWVRWARAWTWFLCEILGRPKDAFAACTKVRQKVPADALLDDDQAVAFLRAEEMACTTLGDFARSRTLVEELIALTERRGDLREQALAWNARAILHFGSGDLADARRAFSRALELARSTGWVRREAIALHNLALVQCELGELDAAHASETRYMELSMLIGNHAAAAEAPAVLAGVALARGELMKAESLLGQARKHSEANGWSMLTAWSRALGGRAKLLRFVKERDPLELTRARSDLLAAIEVFEEQSAAWTEEFDPGEIYALYAAGLKLAGQASQAKEALERAARFTLPQNVVSRRMLEVGRAVVEGKDVAAELAWHKDRGYARVVELWSVLGAAANRA